MTEQKIILFYSTDKHKNTLYQWFLIMGHRVDVIDNEEKLLEVATTDYSELLYDLVLIDYLRMGDLNIKRAVELIDKYNQGKDKSHSFLVNANNDEITDFNDIDKLEDVYCMNTSTPDKTIDFLRENIHIDYDLDSVKKLKDRLNDTTYNVVNIKN